MSKTERKTHRASLKTGLQHGLLALAAACLGACGGGSDGPAIDAAPQSIAFAAAPILTVGGTAQISASASSGLSLSYTSQTTALCSVAADTGVATGVAAGDCVIEARQTGNAHYAPVRATLTVPVLAVRTQTITFGTAPSLTLYGTTTVTASASSRLAVRFSSTTPAVCTVDAASGLVTDLTAGTCTIAADQAGNGSFDPAPTATLTLIVSPDSSTTAPGVPQGVTATLGSTSNSVVVSATQTSAGGSPITGYTVVSTPSGLSASASALPITINCPVAGCVGYAFAVSATNALGTGSASDPAHVLTNFAVTARFFEPDTQPNDSIFTGTFKLDSTTGTVSELAGSLTESMTGSGTTPMTTVPIVHQLSSVSTADGGLLVSSFALNTVNTFWPGGFADTEIGIYYGFPTAYNAATANSFITIYVNPADPTAALNAAQINSLVYGDCAPGGMMGAACMTGVYGGGTMGGYPVTQTITRR